MPSQKKVLFIDTTHPYLIDGLRSVGFECDQFDSFGKSDYENIIHEYFGIIIRSKFRLDKSFLEKAVKLEFIARAGSGLENVDTNYAKSRGITCINAPEGNRDAVGEHAAGMLLVLFNNMLRADKQVRSSIWRREENRGREIMGKTVGIIGYGNTGSAFARRLKGFDANVIAFDKYKSDFSDDFVKEVDMEKIYQETDILSFHVPLSEETTYLFNSNFISNFTKNIYLINTSRGMVVDTRALVSSLKSGKVLGAALDVFEFEKSSFEEIEQSELAESYTWLSKAENVVLSPHVAGWTYESNLKLSRVIFYKIKSKFT